MTQLNGQLEDSWASSATLIPFGYHLESGELVDVGSVVRGNACGCVCPSCKTPLVARHGEHKEWHFAHRSQKVHNETRKECEYSFAVSIRLMIRQLANAGLKFRTPIYERAVTAYSEHSKRSSSFPYVITDEALLSLEEVAVGVDFSGVAVDVIGYVNGVPFIIYVTYKDRHVPHELASPKVEKCGVVELNVDSVPRLFRAESKGQYKEALRRYIEQEVEGKSWIYHPRESRKRNIALKERDNWLIKEEHEAKSRNSNWMRERPAKLGPSSMPDDTISLQEKNPRKYLCVVCRSEWFGTSRSCVKCRTHLYTKEAD